MSNDDKMKPWTCHGKSQKDLVDRLIQAGIVKHESVRDALYRVDRKNYVAENGHPYMDAPQPTEKGQTISAPHMHAHVLEEMYPFLRSNASKGEELRILDVGSGSGYLTAALSRWVAPLDKEGPRSHSSFLDKNTTGKVYGIELHQSLVDLSRRNVEKGDKDLLENGFLTFQKKDGWLGLKEASPFDAIHVGAAATDFPRPLLEQLKVGGVLMIPVGPEYGMQSLYRVERLGAGMGNEDFRFTELLGVRYVPLVQQSKTRN